MIIKPILQRLNDVPKLTPNPNWLETVPTDGLLIIDGDNVRGKTKFRLSKEQLCLDICNLLHSHEIAKKGVIIYFDHGFVQQAFPLPSNSDVIISFSGMHVRADDVIARDLPWIVKSSHSSFPITVVTEDAQLRKRCKKGFTQALRKKDGSKDKNGDDNHSSSTINRFESFEIISSSRFIDNMYEKRTVEVNSPQTFDGEKEERINSMALLSEINEFKQTLESYRHLQHLQAELSSNPIYLNINNKRNKQLLKQRILGLQKMLDIHESDSDRASSDGNKEHF